MRNPILVTLSICGMLLASCGRVDYANKPVASMSEDEAVGQLMEVSLEAGGRNAFGKKAKLSSAELEALIQQIAASGKLGNLGRGAVAGGKLDLSTLTQIFTLLNNGQANSIGSLLNGILAINGGATGTTNDKINNILQIIQMVMPIIASIAPQFAPIMAALVTILPAVMNLIAMLKKPKSAEAGAFLRFSTLS